MLTREEMQEQQRIWEEFARCGCKPFCGARAPEELLLPMKDGVRLRTVICRPELDGPVPTIVIRTCYPQSDYIYRTTAREYNIRGFAYVFQYCRGSGESEGEWEPNVNERADGKETLDWLCMQPWVGNTGYFGCSYLALTGWTIADIVPDKVKTMYLTHYGTYRHVSAYKDGLFRHDVLTAWAMENAGYPVTADYIESCRYRPHVEVDEALWGKRIDWYRKWITSTDRSDPYWNQGFWQMLKEIPSKVKIPVYVGEAWYDHHLGSAIETWKSLSEESKRHSTFLLGAWDHSFYMRLEDRQGKHFENCDILRAFEWFYRILVEEKLPEGKIESYLTGADRWFTRKTWEIPGQKMLRLYIGSGNGKIRSLGGIGNAPGELSFVYDPEHPVPSHGAESMLHTREEQGSLLQPEAGYRADVVSCISEPFEKDTAIAGKIEVVLNVETDVEDTAFVVKVMEVMENGKAYNMRTGITTLAYRGGSDTRQSYVPHTKVCISIDMWDLAWEIKKGSRLRIDITSSDFPQYAVHTNYAGIWSEQKQCRKANQIIYFGGGQESYISLPLLPKE